MTTTTKRPPKLFISRLRMPDGTWTWDDEPRSMRETERLVAVNRCMAGIITQIWPEAEALKIMQEEIK